MKTKILALVLVASLFSCQKKKHFEIVIKGGLVNTGDGEPSIITDIGINADTIAFIGSIKTENGEKVIDANGLVVAPGFIDMHTHLDPIFKYPDAKSLVTQGVTLALGGPDGGGVWPFGTYLDSLEKEQLGMNLAYLVGHNKIRKEVM